MTDFNVGDEVWFVCIDGDIWLIAKGIIKEFPLGKGDNPYPVAIITCPKLKIDFGTHSYYTTRKYALEVMSREVQKMNMETGE